MKEILIDGLKINNEEDLHDLLQKELELPDYYGRNLNALWDCITGGIELPVFITWVNYKESQKKWGKKFVKDFLELLTDAKNELGEDFQFEYS